MKKSFRIDELAQELDVSRRTVEREIKRGAINAFKVGSTWRITRGRGSAVKTSGQEGRKRRLTAIKVIAQNCGS